MKSDTNIYLIIIAICFIVIFNSNNAVMKTSNVYSIATDKYSSYLIASEDIDITPEIQAVANTITKSSSSLKDAIHNTAAYVYKNVDYKGDITVEACYNEKSSGTLDNKIGDCVSMSRLVTSLLRAQGIPARTVGGCIKPVVRCATLFSMIPTEEQSVPKSLISDFKKRGYLHEWVEAFDGENWVIIDATIGRVLPTTCEDYLFYAYDTNPTDRCVINDNNFYNACKAK